MYWPFSALGGTWHDWNSFWDAYPDEYYYWIAHEMKERAPA